MKITTEILDKAFNNLAGPEWKITSGNSLMSDGFSFRISPSVYGIVNMAASRFEYLRDAAINHLVQELRGHQENIVDILSKSIGRPPFVNQTPVQPSGCCKFCGAPYHESL